MEGQNEIDAAVSKYPLTEDKDQEPPKKKRKKNSPEPTVEEPIEVDLTDLTDDQRTVRKMLEKELKLLLLDHPNLDIESVKILDHHIKYLTSEEIASQIENIKIQIGINHPFENSKPMAGLMALGISMKFNHPQVIENMTNDKELLIALEHFFPSSSYHLTPIMKIIYRFAYHLSNSYNETQERKPQ